MELVSKQDPIVIAESGFKSKWRPAMAWIYMIVILFDFVIAPIMTGMYYQMVKPELIIPEGIEASLVIDYLKAMPQQSYVPWVPLTLGAGGFFHITMGAILGISSWTRGKEKVTRLETGIVASDPWNRAAPKPKEPK